MDVAIEMGNCETVVSLFGPSGTGQRCLKTVAYTRPELPEILFCPTLVHWADDVALGQEVVTRGLEGHGATFSDLKDHVLHPVPVARRVCDQRIPYKTAAATFLSSLVRRLREDVKEPLDLALVHPATHVEAFREWLRSVDLSDAQSVTLVDEDTAVALGRGIHLFDEPVILVFDYGFSATRVRVVQFAWRGAEAYRAPCVVAEVSVAAGTADLLRARSGGPSSGPEGGTARVCDSRRLESLLANLPCPDVRAHVHKAVERALDQARLHGIRRDEIRRVVPLGSGSLLPETLDALREKFGDRVLARADAPPAGSGAWALLTGKTSDDRVQHTYSLQIRDPDTGEYRYPVVVDAFTRFPTREPTARYVVNVVYDGQYELHLRLYRKVRSGAPRPGAREVLFGDDRKIRFLDPSDDDDLHEPAPHEPLVIPVTPPGQVGDRRFLLEFHVDGQKRLLTSVRDLRRDTAVWEDRPVADLL